MQADEERGRRRWNIFVWAGFGIALVAFLSYVPFFARFPLTRDFPWANIVLFLAGGLLLGAGLKRAFADPQRYRGKISGSILGALSLVMFGLFCYSVFYYVRQLPSSATAPRPGQTAPDFTLLNAEGNPVSLADLLKGHRAALLIFYRGYW